jgi:hypothetical protein
MKASKGNTDPPKGELLAHDAAGGFSDEVKAALRADLGLASATVDGAGHLDELV